MNKYSKGAIQRALFLCLQATPPVLKLPCKITSKTPFSFAISTMKPRPQLLLCSLSASVLHLQQQLKILRLQMLS